MGVEVSKPSYYRAMPRSLPALCARGRASPYTFNTLSVWQAWLNFMMVLEDTPIKYIPIVKSQRCIAHYTTWGCDGYIGRLLTDQIAAYHKTLGKYIKYKYYIRVSCINVSLPLLETRYGWFTLAVASHNGCFSRANGV